MDNDKKKVTVRIDSELYKRLKEHDDKMQTLVEQGILWRLGQEAPGKNK